MNAAKTIDFYIDSTPDWAQPKLEVVRQIALDCGLTETLKWSAPVYAHKTNVLGLGAFKNWVSIWFFQGVFLADEHNVLMASQDKTKGLRQWRFLPKDDVPVELMRKYILEAITNDEKGMKISPTKHPKKIEVPEILREALAAKPVLLEMFKALSPSQQREYCEYVAHAKQDATKQRRVQKSIDLIAAGKGLNDKYKK